MGISAAWREQQADEGFVSPRGKPQRPWRKYGLTDETYLAMCEQQGGRCAICHEIGRLMVDHDHDTGQVRELLCRRCNVVLGFLRDEPELAELIAAYLLRHELHP